MLEYFIKEAEKINGEGQLKEVINVCKARLEAIK